MIKQRHSPNNTNFSNSFPLSSLVKKKAGEKSKGILECKRHGHPLPDKILEIVQDVQKPF